STSVCTIVIMSLNRNHDAFTNTESLIGDTAKNQVALNHNNTFDEPVVQANMKHWTFKVLSDGGKPKIQVEYNGEGREVLFGFLAILVVQLFQNKFPQQVCYEC
uniref:Uncharacterized protein n=1 Tax=Stegastes partitus TaxID=144197 RepID=A0A3B4ZY76_9TELE